MRPTSVSAAYFQGLNNRRKSAFTLVELLVVIGIIAMLISMLLPALSRARDASTSAQCMSNLRQQGQAVQMYMSDSGGGFLPPYQLIYTVTLPTTPVTKLVQPYIFEYLPALYETQNALTWRCPVDNLMDTVDSYPTAPPIYRQGYPEMISGKPDIAYSYALNFDLPTIGHSIYPTKGLRGYFTYYNPLLGSKITSSSTAAFLMETTSSAALEHSSDSMNFRFDHIQKTAMNVLFVDGHVESMTPKQMLPGNPPDDTTKWPHGFSSFWFGQDGALGPIIIQPILP